MNSTFQNALPSTFDKVSTRTGDAILESFGMINGMMFVELASQFRNAVVGLPFVVNDDGPRSDSLLDNFQYSFSFPIRYDDGEHPPGDMTTTFPWFLLVAADVLLKW